MNRNEKYISRVMFKLKVHESEGQKYEDLFVHVMTKSNTNFEPVKAYGNIGDKKNDGFDRTAGKYYQVFAPEEINKKATIYESVTKLSEDFYGLKKHWETICPIKEYYYVVNDKYKGVPAPIHEEIIKLNKDNVDTIASVFASRHLEDELFKLEDEDIIDVISFVPYDNIGNLDYSILNETIRYIMECDYTDLSSKLGVPDFGNKIIFNKLGETIEKFLTVASYQIGDLDKYFKVNSDYAKNELKLRFQEMYEESKRVIPDSMLEYSGDERFLFILKTASINGKKGVRDAVLVLMSYYFETCDIFEKPMEVS